MIITDRVGYIECVECIPDRGQGTIVSILLDGRAVVRRDCGILNVCEIENLRKV